MMKYSLSFQNQNLQPYEISAPLNQLGYVRAPVQRVNIQLDGAEEPLHLLESIEALTRKGYDYTCSCTSLVLVKLLLSKGIKAYVRWPVTDWETFTYLSDLGVSDILIDGPLGFQHDKLFNRKNNQILIRAIPNYSSIAAIGKLRPSSFFIRPEDTFYYTGIDILEFYHNTIEQEETLFTIYNRGTCLLPLNSLIPELEDSIPNAVISGEEFTERRLNCGQRCMNPEPIHHCNYCKIYLDFLKNVEEWMNSNN